MSCCLATAAVSGRRQMSGGRTDGGQNFEKAMQESIEYPIKCSFIGEVL